jgi:polysaccharide export outer membrane protein
MEPVRRLALALILVMVSTAGAGAQAIPTIPLSPSTDVPQQPAAPNVPGQALVPDSVIHPGDQLSVQVYGDQSLTQTTTVAADGTIDYPLIGRVHVADKSPSAASAAITQALRAYVKDPRVSVSISQVGMMNVLVLGAVKVPGRYQIRSAGHLTDAIAAAGGLGVTNGDFPPARITLPDGSIKTVSLQKLLHDGEAGLNIELGNNSIVYVAGPNTFTVEVVGAVDRPGNVELNEGDRLSMAIARAGTSPNMLSDLSHVVVTRIDKNGKATAHEIDMYKALKDADLRYDPVLIKGDVVYIPQGRRPVALGGFSPLALIQHLLGF